MSDINSLADTINLLDQDFHYHDQRGDKKRAEECARRANELRAELQKVINNG